jgi:hypothetical protein
VLSTSFGRPSVPLADRQIAGMANLETLISNRICENRSARPEVAVIVQFDRYVINLANPRLDPISFSEENSLGSLDIYLEN